MAEAKNTATTEGTKKKRAPFVRGPQKVNLVIRVRDAEGNVRTDIQANQVEVEVTKDYASIVEMLTGPQGAQGALVKLVEIPTAQKTPAATAE